MQRIDELLSGDSHNQGADVKFEITFEDGTKKLFLVQFEKFQDFLLGLHRFGDNTEKVRTKQGQSSSARARKVSSLAPSMLWLLSIGGFAC